MAIRLWLAVIAGLAAGPGVSADKPRIHSTETTLDFHAPADFRFFFDDTGATMRLSDLEAIEQSVANMIQGAQARVLGSCGDGAAINEIQENGNVVCTNTISASVMDRLNEDMTQMRTSIRETRPCTFTAWSAWTDCTSACEATQQRTRTVTRANSGASMSCDEFATVQQRECPDTGACNPRDPDFCNGNERWYYLNSGTESAYVGSYTNQKLIFHRPSASALDGGLPFGKRIGLVRAGDLTAVNAVTTLGLAGYRTGDYFCGSEGGIEVSGKEGADQRTWVPTRLQGTHFLVPAVRGNPQMIYVMALSVPATVTLYQGNAVADEMYLPARSAYSFSMSREGRFVTVNSTAPVLVTYVAATNVTAAGDPRAGLPMLGTPPFAGRGDHMAIPPASPIVFGKSSHGYIATEVGAVRTQCSDNSVSTTQVRGDSFATIDTWTASYAGPTCRAFSLLGNVVSAVSVNDGRNTLAGTPWLPASLMRQLFLVTTRVRYISIICSRPTQAFLHIRRGIDSGMQTIQVTGSGAAAGAWTDLARFMRPGTWIRTAAPCFLVVDGDLGGDEYVIFGQ